jgi:hypothetical protein
MAGSSPARTGNDDGAGEEVTDGVIDTSDGRDIRDAGDVGEELTDEGAERTDGISSTTVGLNTEGDCPTGKEDRSTGTEASSVQMRLGPRSSSTLQRRSSASGLDSGVSTVIGSPEEPSVDSAR